MNFVEIIKQCENANGAGSKKIIQSAIRYSDDDSYYLICQALNPYRVFGVRKYDYPTTFSKTDPTSIDHLKKLLDDLVARHLTGNAARATVTSVLSTFTEETASYIARIFGKDLKAGFSADTVNKIAITRDVIPAFEVMLADKCETAEEFEKKISFPCQADWKFDGMRTIAICRNGTITYYSRSGKEAFHCEGLFDAELQRMREHLGYDFVLDGEAFASNFTETVNAKKSGNDEAKANLRFRAFFLMPYDDWYQQETKITMRQNRLSLGSILELCLCEKITLSEGREVVDYQDMIEYCAEVTTPGFDNQVNGHEGLILKDWESTYEWERSMTWCKVKNFYDIDMKIVGWYKGRKGSRLENTVGGLYMEGKDEKNRPIKCRAGSGIKDKQIADKPGRAELLADFLANNIAPEEDYSNIAASTKSKFMGATAVVKYQEISETKNKDGSKNFSLRFPTFANVRTDKPL